MLWDKQFFSNRSWQEMDKLLREMNALFGSVAPFHSRSEDVGTVGEFPPVNMWSSENEVILTAEIPGIDPAKLEIKALDDIISIQGGRELEEQGEGVTCHRQERNMGNFKRAFKLPFKINADKVEAKYNRGVLHIALPRTEEDKPKTIKVSVS